MRAYSQTKVEQKARHVRQQTVYKEERPTLVVHYTSVHFVEERISNRVITLGDK